MRIATSRSRLLARTVLAAVAGGLLAQASWGASANRPIPAAERERLSKTLDRARAVIPAPPKPFALVKDQSSREVAGEAEWDDGAKRWDAPGSAALERVFEIPESETDTAETIPLEVRLWINRGASVPYALQSVGAAPTVVPHAGALAVEVSTIPAAAESRMMPQSPAQIANALTVMRIYVGPDALVTFLRDAVERQSEASWSPPPDGKPGDARWIVVELYGGKRAVEDLAARVDASKLRRLLSR